jgi:hypothetical protein
MLLFRDWLARADGGGDMTDLHGVIGLLYRADWTRLSLSADAHSETDQDLWMSRVRAMRPPWVPEGPLGRFWRAQESSPPAWEQATGEELGGYHSWDTRLLIAPGGRYRQENLDEPSGRIIGSDGERSWVWRQQDPASPPADVGHRPPLQQPVALTSSARPRTATAGRRNRSCSSLPTPLLTPSLDACSG